MYSRVIYPVAKMQRCQQVRLAICFILFFLVTCVCGHEQSSTATSGVNAVEEKLCHRLRQEISALVKQAYAQSSYPVFMKEMLPDWIDLFLPQFCRNQLSGSTVSSSRRSRTTSQFRVNDHTSSNQQNMLIPGKNVDDTRMVIPKENYTARENVIRSRRDASAHTLAYPRGGERVYRVKRFLMDGFNQGTDFREMLLKRFNLAPARQPIQLPQMLYYFIRNLNPYATTLTFNNLLPRRHGRRYVRREANFGSMTFGDAFSRRNKREVRVAKRDEPTDVKRRTKRFLLGEMAEIQPMPSMFSIMAGTATDPNTGKPIEFGGDVMRNMIVNSFTSMLPPGAQPPPGKEPNELIQVMAPMWYFSNMQQVMNSLQSRRNSITPNRIRNQNGYYGDIVPGKKRRR